MHPNISVNNICFMDETLEQQLAHWPSLQVSRVSLVGPQVDAADINIVKSALAQGGYQLETVVHPFSSQTPLTSDTSTWIEPRKNLSAQIEMASELGARSIYMTTGGHGDLVWEQAAEVFSAAVAPCAAQARAAGIALMIENAPPVYADLHIAHSLRDTISLAEMAGIGVCIDLVGCWTEADLKNLIARAVPICDLVQVSDYVCGDRNLPGRAVPGDGDVPLARLIDWLFQEDYQGTFDLELLGPRIDREGHLQAVQRSVHNLEQLLLDCAGG
ncbi:MAG: sugar phosphate isomerase/epimerase [Halieaceae bacterium]|jgi:sugar phosphate isomerase/epimerase